MRSIRPVSAHDWASSSSSLARWLDLKLVLPD
jgi:hypothetical protein